MKDSDVRIKVENKKKKLVGWQIVVFTSAAIKVFMLSYVQDSNIEDLEFVG